MGWPSRDAVRMALQAPLRNWGRSFLTVLGLAIGVGAFIAMVSFGQGARTSVVAQFETLGTNVLKLRPRHGMQDGPVPITDADVEALHREATTLDVLAPSIKRPVTFVHGAQQHRGLIYGATNGFLKVRNWQMAGGGMFDDHDQAQRAAVCVLGATPARALFSDQDPLGQAVTIDGILTCRVVGVLTPLGQSIAGADLDEVALLPVSTHKLHFGVAEGYSFVEVQPKSRELLLAAKEEVREILRRSHKIPPDAPDDFDIVSPDEITRVADRVSSILTGLLGAIAGVSLLVGGVGIMNIQLVSVAERTHEIGVRSALGASPRQILSQFVAEAVVLAVLGSLMGALVGVGISFAVAWRMGWGHITSPAIVLSSIAFGVIIGTVFGYIPARRAAALHPIEALRRE